MHRIRTGFLALSGAAAVAGAQCCSSGGPCSVQELLAGSQLAFEGEVTAIDYANSLPAADAPEGIPHTFVTYRVDRVLYGFAPDREITLRFMGGWDPATQTFLHVSLVPEFDVGDRDILFVRGNGSLGAPLVGNRAGRLRVSNGQVYSDTGRAVHVDEKGHIERGERYSLPEVGSVSVLGSQLWIGLDPEAIEGPSDAMTSGAFANVVSLAGARLAPPAAPFVGAHVGQAFASPFPAPEPMLEQVESLAPADTLDPEAIEEILADESGLAEEYAARLRDKPARNR